MKIKYKARIDWDDIIPIEFDITKESETYFWVNSKKYKKQNQYEAYFDSFESAKEFLIIEANNRIEKAKKGLQYEIDKLEKINKI